MKRSTPAADLSASPVNIPPLPSATVLWIDDQLSPSDACVRLLALDGFRVECVTNGTDGLVRWQNARYDAVILDLCLPDMPGLQLLQTFARGGAGVPVVVLTGYGDFEAARLAGRFGAVRFEAKPLLGDELAQILRDTIRSSMVPPQRALDALVPTSFAHPVPALEPAAAAMERGLESAPGAPDTAALSRKIATMLVTADLSASSFLKCATLFRATLRAGASELTGLRYRLQNFASPPLPPHSAAPTARVAEAIERLENSARPHSIRERSLAEDLFVDPGHLARRFHAETGLHFREWRAAVVMRRAVRRIACERAPISEISWDVGFEHLSGFDREFARIFGLRPTTFRHLYRRWITDDEV